MKLKSFTLAGMIIVLLFGGIIFTSAMNWWQTESNKEPVRYTEGEAAGEYNPADIRGSYTFGEVSELFDVPLADLQAAFRIPADVDPAAYPLKSLETQFADLPVEVGTASVRMFVAFYHGLPFDLASIEDTYLLEEAVTLLGQRGTLTPKQAAYLSSHTAGSAMAQEAQPTPEPAAVEAQPAAVEAQPTATVHEPEAFAVTGKTTFKDLLDWGLTQDMIKTILGEDMPAGQMLVKDYATSKGITFSELKSKLQAEVDKQHQ